MLTHPTGLFSGDYISATRDAGPSNFTRPISPINCISSRAWGAGWPQVGLCPIFLVTVIIKMIHACLCILPTGSTWKNVVNQLTNLQQTWTNSCLSVSSTANKASTLVTHSGELCKLERGPRTTRGMRGWTSHSALQRELVCCHLWPIFISEQRHKSHSHDGLESTNQQQWHHLAALSHILAKWIIIILNSIFLGLFTRH